MNNIASVEAAKRPASIVKEAIKYEFENLPSFISNT